MRHHPGSFILGSFLIVGAALAAVSTSGCDGGGGGGGGTGGGGGGDSACFDYSSFDAMTPAVTFRTDVLPFFQTSCTLSTACHGDASGISENRPYLGPSMAMNPMPSDTDIEAILAAIVGVQSYYEGAMSIVEAGDPENSFIMYKIDHTLECSKLACAENKACGTPMPQTLADPVDQASRDKVRRWIAQGAQNN